MKTIVLVGRPNVGKSTLFNRMVGKALAIVDDQPGVTRDWRDAEASLFDTTIRLLDTAGWDKGEKGSLTDRMRENTEQALKQAHAAIFVVDGDAGATPVDEAFAKLLRKSGKPVVIAVNKCDRKSARASIPDFWRLGFDEPIGFSAVHGDGLSDLYHAILALLPKDAPHDPSLLLHEEEVADPTQPATNDFDLDALEGDEFFEFQETEIDESLPLKVAVIGRPNAGKSTLINSILGEDRLLTGPEAGITRDAIAVEWNWQGRKFRLVDTAGLRRKSRVVDTLEKRAGFESLRAIRLAQVVVLLVDGTLGFDKQEQALADLVVREGRGLVVAFNKLDAVEDSKELREESAWRLQKGLGQLPDVPVVFLSGIYGRGLDRLFKEITHTFDRWQGRVSTGKLNRWVAAAESKHPPALVNGRPNRLRYMTQIKSRPPTFVLWCSRPDAMGDDYQRYLINGLRRDFDLGGIPIRLMLRTSKNPYANK